MASPPPRIHGISDFSEFFRLVEDNKYTEYDAYLVATRRIENRPLAADEGLDALGHEVLAAAAFYPGRGYPQRGAKPQAVLCCGQALEVDGERWQVVYHATVPPPRAFAEPVHWKIRADADVPDFDSFGLSLVFPEPFVVSAATTPIRIAREGFDLEVTVERARPGAPIEVPADLLTLGLTYQMPGRVEPHSGHRFEQRYEGPIEGDMYSLVTRIDKMLDDRPPSFAPGQASAVVRASRRVDVVVKPPGPGPEGEQRWLLVTTVEAEVPVEWVE